MSKHRHQADHDQATRNGKVADQATPPPKTLPPSVAHLILALNESCSATRHWAAGQLGRIAPLTPEIRVALRLRAVIDPVATVRQAAEQALAAIQARARTQDKKSS